jgi:hypothetical protein
MDRQITREEIAEATRERMAQHADTFAEIGPEARRLVAETLAARPVRRRHERPYQELLGRAAARLLQEDEDFRRGHELFTGAAKGAMTAHLPEDAPGSVRALTVPVGRARADIPANVFSDWRIWFLEPPYLNAWVHITGDQSHEQQTADAFDATGVFRFITNIGDEGGSAETLVGILASYVPTGKHPTMQLIPDIPYQQIWRDISYAGTAHNDAGFGLLVHSWDPSTGRNTNESDNRYSIWSDGTSWAEDHSNPSYSSWDTGQAFDAGQVPLSIPVTPNLVYTFAFYAWGSCDADGKSFWGSSYAMQAINATLQSIEVDES